MGYRAFISKVRTGKEEDYIAAHQAVWPELIHAMKEVGIEKESCFLFKNLLVVYVEAADIDTALEKLQSCPINREWDVFMAPLLEPPLDGCLDLFPQMVEVFKL
jgi:L-rhamnose mutarotase